MTPAEVTEDLLTSEIRGRGGAFFATGRKWSFVPTKEQIPKPHYLVVNADESEPGSFKDNEILARVPHRFIEGCLITAHAIDCQNVFVYIRGEYSGPYAVLVEALEELKDRPDIRGDVTIVVHRGAGAYICGEETALLESLEGKRGQPRSKPPFPAISGLYASPTLINNVETIATVPVVLQLGGAEYSNIGPPDSTGTRVFSLSGNVANGGNFELENGTTLRELIYEHGGGIPGGRKLKAIIPGGSSVPLLLDEQLDTPASFDHVQKAGSLLGSAGLIVLDDSVCMVWLAMNLLHFYRHESCGKCTPCREGGDWLYKLLQRIERGEGQDKDLDLLFGVANNIVGKTLCAFGDAAATPVLTTLKLFRAEYEAHVREGHCTIPAEWRATHPVLAGAH
jgi:NADH-quinone oxidoreductase subunit F